MTNAHLWPAPDWHRATLEGYLRPPQLTLRILLEEARREWGALREADFTRRGAFAFVLLRIVQRLAYARGWKDGSVALSET